MLRRAARARLAPFGAGVVLLAVLVALAAPLLAPYDPVAQNLGNTLARPGRANLLGTDNVGRDVLSRVIWGTRVSLVAGLVAVAIAVVAGSLLGVVAGYCGGRVDGLVMRLMDAVLSFPPLVLALALGAVLGAGLTGVLVALGVVYTPTFARLMRGQVLTINARDYVEAARALGAPGWRVAWRHVVPNAANPIIVQASERGVRHPRRGLAVLPRPRHPAAPGVLGQHDQRGARLPAAGALDRLRAGRRPVRDRGGIELRRRCRARRARSANARVIPRYRTCESTDGATVGASGRIESARACFSTQRHVIRVFA